MGQIIIYTRVATLGEIKINYFHCSNNLSGSENIGIVKGVPQMKPTSLEVKEYLFNSPQHSPKKNGGYSGSEKSESPSQRVAPPYKDPPAPPPYRDPPPPNSSIYHDKYKKNANQVTRENINNFLNTLFRNINLLCVMF